MHYSTPPLKTKAISKVEYIVKINPTLNKINLLISFILNPTVPPWHLLTLEKFYCVSSTYPLMVVGSATVAVHVLVIYQTLLLRC